MRLTSPRESLGSLRPALHWRSFAVAAVLVLLPAERAAAIGRPRLAVDDITQGGQSWSSWPQEMYRVGDRVVFAASDPLHGFELRSTDLQASHYDLLIDANPGTADSTVRFVAAFEGRLAYLIGPSWQFSLYLTDGTPSGTRRVISSGGSQLAISNVHSSYPEFAVAGGRLIIAAASLTNFRDGVWAVSADGAAELLRIAPETVDIYWQNRFVSFAPVGERVFFQDVNFFDEGRVCVTDGTIAGTSCLGNEIRGDGGYSGSTNEKYFFFGLASEEYGLFASDGSTGGTTLLRTWPDSPFQAAQEIYSGPSRVYFVEPQSDGLARLSVSDGTAAGTAQLSRPEHPSLDAASDLAWLGETFFVWEEYVSDGSQVWAHDAVGSTPRRLTVPFPDGRPWSGPLTILGDAVLFYVYNEDWGYELWRSDGTDAGTHQLSHFTPEYPLDGYGSPGIDIGGIAMFVLEEECHLIGGCWWLTAITDGTAAGTRILDESVTTVFSGYPGYAVRVPGGILVQGEDAATGAELWEINDQDGSLRQVGNLMPETNSSQPRELFALGDGVVFEAGTPGWYPSSWSLTSLDGLPQPLLCGDDGYPLDLELQVNNHLLTTCWNWMNGELRIQSLSEGATIPEDLNVTAESDPYLRHFVSSGGFAFVLGGGSDEEIVRTDGTVQGTTVLHVPGLSPYAELVAATATHLFLQAGQFPVQWISVNLADFTISTIHREPLLGLYGYAGEQAVENESFFFTSRNAGSIEELWVSNGTTGGTGAIWRSAPDERVLDLFPAGQSLYFLAGSNRMSLWRTNGTALGTIRVAELGPLNADADDELPRDSLELAGRLYFVAETSPTGRELWATDGTSVGTTVLDLWPGEAGSAPRGLAAAGGLRFFSADDPYFGREVWASDGTLAGTIRVSDIGAGPQGADPEWLTGVGSTLYFAADDALHARELWAIDALGVAAPCSASASRLCLLNGRFEIEAFWSDFAESSDAAVAVPLTDASGLFWFFDDAAIELAVKMVDACGVDGFDNFWVYATGLTNLDVTVAVTDTSTLERRIFHSELGEPFGPFADVARFQACDPPGETANDTDAAASSASNDACAGSPATLCLQDGRFEVTVDWATAAGRSGTGQPVALSTESGYFTFFVEANVEILVRVIDGCDYNSRYWVFAAGLTDVATHITIRDTLHPEALFVRESPLGTLFEPILDIDAVATCP